MTEPLAPTEPAESSAAFEVRPGRGPRLRTLAGHDGSYFDVFEVATDLRVARYVGEDRATEYAGRLNLGELPPSPA